MNTNNIVFNKFSSLMENLYQSLNLLNRDEKLCYGLTMSQCHVLETLARNGKITMGKLSREQGLSVSTVTRILDVLVRDRIVTRKENPSDRRQVYVELTPKGRELASKLKECCQGYSKKILNNISSGKRNEVLKSLETLVDTIKSLNRKCCK